MGGVRGSGPCFYLRHEGLDSRLRGNDGREKLLSPSLPRKRESIVPHP